MGPRPKPYIEPSVGSLLRLPHLLLVSCLLIFHEGVKVVDDTIFHDYPTTH